MSDHIDNEIKELAQAMFRKALTFFPPVDPEIRQLRDWASLPQESLDYWVAIAQAAKKFWRVKT